MINFSVSRPGSMSKPMRACDNKKQSPQKKYACPYTHTCNPTFHLPDSHKKALFLLVFTICIVNLGNGTYSQSFAPNCLRGEQIGALFNSHSFCTVVVDVESLKDLCGRKKGQLCSAIAFVSSLGALQKRIHVRFELVPARTACF